MVPSSVVTAFGIAAICTLVLPVVLLVVLAVMKKTSGVPLLLGAAAFFVSQIVLRIPLMSVLSSFGWYQNFATMYVPYILFLCLTAGLFEESARLGGAVLLKKKRSFRDVISFGLGHGLCEVILLIGIGHVSNVVLCITINSGEGALTAALPPETLEAVKSQLVTAAAGDVYWGILERVSAVLFHIFATALVFQGVVKKKWQYYVCAIAAHTLFNLTALVVMRYTDVAITEIVLLILALAASVYVLKSRRTFDAPPPEPMEASAAM